MIISKAKHTHRHPGLFWATTLAAVASLAMVAIAAEVSNQTMKPDPTDAGRVEPYPETYDIGIGEQERLNFAGTWNPPRPGWETAPFLVESDVPVVLNRITSGSASQVDWAVPQGISIIVKTDCSNSISNDNDNESTFLENEIDIEIRPVVTTEMAVLFVNGLQEKVPKISITINPSDEQQQDEQQDKDEQQEPPSISLAESRMTDNYPPNGNFLPSSDFIQNHKCWGWRGECVPKNESKIEPEIEPEIEPVPSFPVQTETAPPDKYSDPGSTTDDATSSPVAAAADSPTSSPVATTTNGPTSSPIAITTTAMGASSASSAKIATNFNFVLGIVSTLSMLVFGTVGIAFDKNQGRNAMIGIAAVTIVTTMFIAFLPVPSSSSSSFSSSLFSDGGSRRINDIHPFCTVSVEIVYFGCQHEVYIDAPGVSLRNNVDESESNLETCECQEKMTFIEAVDDAAETEDADQGETLKPTPFDTITEVDISGSNAGDMVYRVLGGEELSRSCRLAVGRPYRDNTGSVVSSSICDATEEKPWSEPSLSFLSDRDSMAVVIEEDRRRRLGNPSNRWNRERLGREWTNRALGEHASIASFAAFTLALMSNQAPPDLIRDSLTAAQDELRHAKISFEIASMLLSQTPSDSIAIVEPTALPPSELKFGNNMTELALGTAQEGCVDETLSAIEMAVEYDEFIGSGDGNGDLATEVLIMETIKTIAMEEGNHSAVAWRTVKWICSSSSDSHGNEACQTAQQQILNPLQLAEAGEKRFPSSPQARQIWECIWTTLLPTIGFAGGDINGDDNVDVVNDEINVNGRCSLYDDIGVVSDDDNATKLSELLAGKIVSQVKADATFGAKRITETK
jgi:hypothetical protein